MSKNKKSDAINKEVLMVRSENPEIFRQLLEQHVNDKALEMLGTPCAIKHHFVAYFVKENK